MVPALLVACSRTYTLDRTFDLGSRGIADDLGPYVTGYVERGGGLVQDERNRGTVLVRLAARQPGSWRVFLVEATNLLGVARGG